MPPNPSSNSIAIAREKLLSEFHSKPDDFATKFSDRLFQTAIDCNASDLHLDATAHGLEVRMRADGLLIELVRIPLANATHVTARIKTISGLLSYKTDVPQEGRIHFPAGGCDARVCTMPTLHGERIAIRFSISQSHHWSLSDLGLESQLISRIHNAVGAASGVILIGGPAGAGKTTTAYAMMQQLANADNSIRRSLVSLEDPIEQSLDGVSQSQIQPSVGYTWSAGLKAMLRQDPEVMLIGEIRDAETAHIVFQAAMSGQLVITTMHARSVADALMRLIDMQVPIHHIVSGLSLLMVQRLLRITPNETSPDGSRNRQLIAETLPNIEHGLRQAIIDGDGVQSIHEAALAQGLVTLRVQAQRLLDQGTIDEPTFRRHFERQRND
jgi:type II secretory ATPase GspE/PulE/Tfp pilus assembly ATPase PilB-like protein